MSVYPVHDFFVENGRLFPADKFIDSGDNGGIYEVLRVVDGVPLFWEDHAERFFSSAKLADFDVNCTAQCIKKGLMELIRANQTDEGNILISYKKNLKAFFIPHTYPDPEHYEKGVECGILKAERTNPNAKVFQTVVRKKADKLIRDNGFYEVLLVDHLGRITEGSRSNIFFVKEGRVFTPPGHEVLLGITRMKTIYLAAELKIPVSEQDILLDEAGNYEAAFITGTSPKILPVNKIGHFRFNPGNEIVQQLIKSYNELIAEYIAGFKF